MQTRQLLVPKLTSGLDVGDRSIEVCSVDASGNVVDRATLSTHRDALERWFGSLEPHRVVLETGKHSPWMSRALEALGHETIVANARRVQLIWRATDKDDPVDAETLARLGRADPALLRPIQHRGEQTQADLALIRARDALVRSRTLMINHVRGVVKSCGGRIPKSSAPSFAAKAAEHLPDRVEEALSPLLDVIETITERIRSFERQIEQLAQGRYPEVESLRQVQGVGTLTALAFVLVLEDPGRFRNGRSVGAYLGLVPRRRKSGSSEPQLRITKTGDELLRRLLVQSANYILGPFGPDCDLRRHGERICARGGKNAKKRAKVAVARKLSSLLYHLWVSGEVYEPLHSTRRAAAA